MISHASDADMNACACACACVFVFVCVRVESSITSKHNTQFHAQSFFRHSLEIPWFGEAKAIYEKHSWRLFKGFFKWTIKISYESLPTISRFGCCVRVLFCFGIVLKVFVRSILVHLKSVTYSRCDLMWDANAFMILRSDI